MNFELCVFGTPYYSCLLYILAENSCCTNDGDKFEEKDSFQVVVLNPYRKGVKNMIFMKKITLFSRKIITIHQVSIDRNIQIDQWSWAINTNDKSIFLVYLFV